jgi:hypothetical protein
MSSSSDESSSYEESDSSDVASDKVWTCDDIYPAKGNKTSDSDDYSSSSEASFDEPRKSHGNEANQVHSSSSESNNQSSDESESESEDDSDSDDGTPSRPPERRSVQRNSSGEIEGHLTAQSRALTNAKLAEEVRRKAIESDKGTAQMREQQEKEVPKSIESHTGNHTKESATTDASMESLKKLVDLENAERNINNSDSGGVRSEEKAKFEKRNMEREMRLAKARERIEKKKEDEAAKEAKERLKDKDSTSKLDMSKAARVERAYSWYSRMAMPTREKMKERVEFMPASSGVTPDDVDLLPWNARGTFVSVAAMMRMNRTASSFKKPMTNTVAESETDSD